MGIDPPSPLALLAPALLASGCYLSHVPARSSEPADAAVAPDVPSGCSERWELFRDLALERNPAGPWAYGWERADGAFEHGTAIAVEAMSGWAGPFPGGDERFPYVLCNTTAEPTRYRGSVPYAPGECGMHPASACEPAILRWSAPETGVYAFAADAVALDGGGPSASVRVAGVAHASAATLGPALHDEGSMRLEAGQSIELVIGCGPDGVHYEDSVGVALSVCRAR